MTVANSIAIDRRQMPMVCLLYSLSLQPVVGIDDEEIRLEVSVVVHETKVKGTRRK